MKRTDNFFKIKKILLLIVVVLIYNKSFANIFSSKIIFTESSKPKLIGNQVLILEDKSNLLTFENIFKSSNFLNSNALVPNLGVTNNTYWIKFSITNISKYSELILEVAQPTLENIELYSPINDRKYTKIALGINKEYNRRFYDNQNYLFKINIAPKSTKMFFFKLNSKDQVMLPMYLGTSQAVLESLTKKDLIFGLFLGTLITMLLYNLFIYYSVSDKIYLYYVFYIFLTILVQGSLQGYNFRFVWPQYFLLEKLSIFISPAIADIGVIVFAMVFLNTKGLLPKYHSLLKLFILVLAISVILALFRLYTISFNVMQLSTIFASFTLLFISISLVNQGYRPARFFLISWSFLLTGAIIFVLKDFGILPYNLFTSYSLEIGSAFEVILLSFALADKINIYKKEKEQSQAATLSALQENEKIISEQNSTLERKVKERTNELVATNKNLNKTLTDLKEAQTQLVEAEKMASLGQLTAGIAHEINNPINFVTSNVGPLKRDVDILVDAIINIESLGLSAASIDEKQQQIDDYKEEIDLDYLKVEIGHLLNGIHEGATRTADIVKGLKIFSRLDEDDLKKADINEGINSTLTIANNLIGNKIQVIRNMDNIPVIECYPGKLNQVFLNIISNAVFAIQEKFGNQTGGILKISTSYDETYLTIKIEDNGTGMSEATKKKIFEPFFTTKNVGVGTGLGMSIVYNTIKKHNAEIYLNSTEGIGTEFVIQLNLVFTEPIADYQSEQQG